MSIYVTISFIHSNSYPYFDSNITSKSKNNRRIYPLLTVQYTFLHSLLFEQHHFFGIDKEDFYFFSQGVFPSLDKEGRVIMMNQTEVTLQYPPFYLDFY